MNATIRARPWRSDFPPKKILAMRFQALGDTIITLPYLQSLKRQYPQTKLHFLTRKEVSAIPQSIELFDKVIELRGERNLKVQFLLLLLKLPWLWWQNYDVVLDLQNHTLSRFIRMVLFKKAWAEFDKHSPLSAGERSQQTIEALWSWTISLDTHFTTSTSSVQELLKRKGLRSDHALIVLNPAGYCSSRHWPLENYVVFARQWLKRVNPKTQFVLLLLETHREKANYFMEQLGDSCIDLTGQADQVQAFSILKLSKLMLTEDSGLMHMAWVQGVPTLALFSSSRKDWSAPQGAWSACLDSSDLECGPCQLEVCKYNDNRCLTRYTPDFIVEESLRLLEMKNKFVNTAKH